MRTKQPRTSRRIITVSTVGAVIAASFLAAAPANAAVTLSGTLLDAGTPVVNASVLVLHYDPSLTFWTATISATTDAAGNWSGSGALTDGAYEVYYSLSATAADYSLDQTGRGSHNPYAGPETAEFTVSGGAPSVSSFPHTLVRDAGIVEITQRNVNSSAIITGGTATFDFEAGVGASPLAGEGLHVSESSSDGTLRVVKVPAGTYSLGSTAAPGYDDEVFAAPLAVIGGQTNAFSAYLHPAADPSVGTLYSGSLPYTQIYGAPKVGSLLTSSVPAIPGTTVGYEWVGITLYDSDLVRTPIVGASGPTYVPVTADLGKVIGVYAIYHKDGYSPIEIDPIPTYTLADQVTVGDPTQATVTVAGSAKYGKTVHASVTGSSVPSAKWTYQWYRNGVPQGGKDGSTYTLGKSDVGKDIRVSISVFAQGHTDNVIPSPAVRVRDTASVKVSLDKTIKTSTKLKVSVTVKAGSSKVAVTGTAKVYYSATKFKTITFKKAGKKSVTLPKLSKGKHSIKVVFESSKYSTKTIKNTVKVSK